MPCPTICDMSHTTIQRGPIEKESISHEKHNMSSGPTYGPLSGVVYCGVYRIERVTKIVFRISATGVKTPFAVLWWADFTLDVYQTRIIFTHR